jgi:hypothetical protein
MLVPEGRPVDRPRTSGRAPVEIRVAPLGATFTAQAREPLGKQVAPKRATEIGGPCCYRQVIPLGFDLVFGVRGSEF